MCAHVSKELWAFGWLLGCFPLSRFLHIQFMVWVEIFRCEWRAALPSVDVCNQCLHRCGAQPCCPVLVFEMPAVVQIFPQCHVPKLIGKIPCLQGTPVQFCPGYGVGAFAPAPFPSVSSFAPVDSNTSLMRVSMSKVPTCAANCSQFKTGFSFRR